MLDLIEATQISKRDLLRVAKENPAAIFRLAKFLRLKTNGYSPRQTAKLINWLLKRRNFLLSRC